MKSPLANHIPITPEAIAPSRASTNPCYNVSGQCGRVESIRPALFRKSTAWQPPTALCRLTEKLLPKSIKKKPIKKKPHQEASSARVSTLKWPAHAWPTWAW